MKEKIQENVKCHLENLQHITEFLYQNPEISGEEFNSSAFLVKQLKNYGFKIETPFLEIENSFRAEYDSGKDGASIAFFCEYDALPEIGHGCGHNLISAMSIGAALGIKPFLEQIGGKIILFGTPAEETNGAKVEMAEKGAFDHLTAAMMIHPNTTTEESGSSLALYPLEVSFYGKAAHAAMAPEKGINALDAVILLFNSLYTLKNQYTNDVNIHGVITNGGSVANIIPDFAQAHFYVRAPKKKQLNQVIEQIHACVHGAAAMTGTRSETRTFEACYDDLNTNPVLSKLFNQNLFSLGEEKIKKASLSLGSIDIGNVSYRIPSIHPWLGIGNEDLVLHTKEFADFTITKKGFECLYKGACAMALTAYDVMKDPEILTSKS